MSEKIQFLIAALLFIAMFCALGFVVQRRRGGALAQELRQESERRELAEEELRGAYHHLRDLGRHLLALQEEERGRIAARIHDELGQALTAISLDVAWIESHQTRASDAIEQRFTAMKNVIGATLVTVRRLATELKPRILEESGLAAAIEWQIRDQCRRSNLEGSFTSEVLEVRSLLPDLAAAMFRNLQELLANVVRHANARRVRVTLEELKGDLVLTVADDGRGFDQEDLSSGSSFGFLQVRDRALYWGGTVDVKSQSGGGAVVEVRVPCQRI